MPARKTPENRRNWVEKHIVYSVTSLLSCRAANETVTGSGQFVYFTRLIRGHARGKPPAPSTPLLSHAFCKWKQDQAIAVDIETPQAKQSSSSPEQPELPAGMRPNRTLLHRAAPGFLTDPTSSRHCRAALPAPALGARAAQLLPLPRLL